MEYQVRPKKNSFATASMILGILALLTIATVFLPLPLAALGILFASLAHRKGRKRDLSCIAGLATSVIALVISLSFMVSSIAMIPTLLTTPEYRQQLDEISEGLYGESFDDMVEELYGIDLDELLEDKKKG